MKSTVIQGVCLCLIAAISVLVQCDTSHDLGLLKENMVRQPAKEKNVGSHPNRTKTHLLVVSFTIFRKTNSTGNGTEDPYRPQGFENTGEKQEQSTFYNNKLRMPWLNQVPMRFLYLIASSSLLLLFLMIIKIILSRKGKTDYSLVTKGDFDA